MDRPDRRKTLNGHIEYFFSLYIIAQREVTQSIIYPEQMKKAHWLPCQPLIFPMKINREEMGFTDNGKVNDSWQAYCGGSEIAENWSPAHQGCD